MRNNFLSFLNAATRFDDEGDMAVRFRFRLECEQGDFNVLAARLKCQLTELVPCIATGVFCTAEAAA